MSTITHSGVDLTLGRDSLADERNSWGLGRSAHKVAKRRYPLSLKHFGQNSRQGHASTSAVRVVLGRKVAEHRVLPSRYGHLGRRPNSTSVRQTCLWPLLQDLNDLRTPQGASRHLRGIHG